MNDDHKYVKSIVSQRLMRLREKNNGILEEGSIAEQLDKELKTESYNLDRNMLLAELENSFATIIAEVTQLISDSRLDKPDAPWVVDRMNNNQLQWQYWSRYRQYLLADDWDATVVGRLDDTTTKILDGMMPPDKPGEWDQRGLVVGSVQSGKTANYTGLICKAVDAGYKVVIVLAGAHNNLRAQTQVRLEEGFLGYTTTDEDINRRDIVGAGRLNVVEHLADTITTRNDNGDFKTGVAKNFAINPGGNPLLFVVKKNTTVLKNVHKWVKDAASIQSTDTIKNIPLLMIDDEADYASIDTGLQGKVDGIPDPEYDPKKINAWIRKILKAFQKSVYIGYTATPFANIFISEKASTKECGEDLFPRSFIYALPIPSNYVGSARIFGADNEATNEGLPLFKPVSDFADSMELTEKSGWMPPRHTKLHVPKYLGVKQLPPSLTRAIKVFVLATAARKARGQKNKHNSMLIHVTRFVDVQTQVKNQVDEEFLLLKDRIIYGDGGDNSVMDELKTLWHEEFEPVSSMVDFSEFIQLEWSEVQARVAETVNNIVVREINGSSGDFLEYKKRSDAGLPYDVIVIGGDKLSRGLTLEGLTISYFLRASKMYDTLMQMGRWFGFRPGYLDLCRIFTTKELIDWFKHISKAEDELRRDFNQMVASGGTPRDYGHRVLMHPKLMVTSPVKMRHTEKRQTSFEGCIVETTLFKRDQKSMINNLGALKNFVKEMEFTGHCESSSRLLWKDVKADLVLSFLGSYTEHFGTIKARPEYLKRYIGAQLQRKMLTSWTVYISQGVGKSIPLSEFIEPKTVKRTWFNRPQILNENDPFRVRRVGSPADEYIDLVDDNEMQEALEKTIKIWEVEKKNGTAKSESKPTKPSGPGVRATRSPKRGLLCIYLVINPENKDLPFIGFFFSFPGDTNAKPIQYLVGEVYRRQELAGVLDE